MLMLKCIKLITMGQPRCGTSLRGTFAFYMTQIMLPATTPK